jgi:hypothetical protein
MATNVNKKIHSFFAEIPIKIDRQRLTRAQNETLGKITRIFG